jgi:REP element-mobilizing transposase RayT
MAYHRKNLNSPPHNLNHLLCKILFFKLHFFLVASFRKIYAQNHIHLVFSTKNREKIFARNFLPRLWAYTAAVCKNHDLLTFAVGGMEDHIHLLFRLPPTMPLTNAVALVKSNSSKWISEQGKDFAWQEGYGAFSVSSSNISAVIKCIGNQEAHHRKLSFEDEFIALLKKHKIPFDPKYVFG